MRILSWLIGLPIAIVAALFAVSNKTDTTFALWPLPFTLEAPLYLATLIALVGGFVIGGLIAWMGQGGVRARANRLAHKLATTEGALKAAQARAASAEKQLAEAKTPVSGEPKTVTLTTGPQSGVLPPGAGVPRLTAGTAATH